MFSNNVVCATSKGSDQPVHTRSLIRAFASRLNILGDRTSFGVSKLKRKLHRLVWIYTCQNAALLEITCHGSYTHRTKNKGTLEFFILRYFYCAYNTSKSIMGMASMCSSNTCMTSVRHTGDETTYRYSRNIQTIKRQSYPSILSSKKKPGAVFPYFCICVYMNRKWHYIYITAHGSYFLLRSYAWWNFLKMFILKKKSTGDKK